MSSTSSAPAKRAGIKKQQLKRITECRITFRQPKEATPGYNLVALVGDLHNRSTCRNPMKRLQSADYTVALKLQLGKEYKFR